MFALCNELIESLSRRYGQDEQIRAAVGECGEFIAAAQNFHRAQKYGQRTETLETLMEEAVDVYFLMQQMRFINPDMFDRICLEKIDKVIKRLHEIDKVIKRLDEGDGL